MFNKFFSALRSENTKSKTENGAPTFTSTLNSNLDFFALAGAKRNTPDEAVKLFKDAIDEDTKLAILNLFYLRDVRGGQGEREIFRKCLPFIPKEYLENKDFLKFIPEYGRWDDLLSLINQPITLNGKKAIVDIVFDQINEDFTSEHPSLLAKWIPLPNSVKDRNRKNIGYYLINSKYGSISNSSQGIFRKIIVTIRNKISIVEQKLSKSKYSEIDYNHLPSCAFNKYKGAFRKKDFLRFTEFMNEVSSGKKSLNMSCIYPHQIINQIRDSNKNEMVLEEMWKNLPSLNIKGNILTVVDVSGSMMWGESCSVNSIKPIDVSLGLGIYTAEHICGEFANKIISFHENPKFIDLSSRKTLCEKIKKIESEGIGYNTNIQKVFDLVLNAINHNYVPVEEQPSTILMISDMEFDSVDGQDNTNFEVIKQKFDSFGIKMPQFVFWNVASRGQNIPVRQNENGVTLVSGLSTNTLKFVTSEGTPFDFMMTVLNSERYQPIKNFLN